MRIRPAPVVALAALVALAGCGQEQPDGDRPPQDGRQVADEVRFMGTDSTCQETPTRPMTRPFQTITVEDGEIVVDPDTVIQPPEAGVFGWMSPDHHWRISYPEGESPLEMDSYTGEPGELVWAGVRENAGCQYYKYDIEVWGEGLQDTLERDPGGAVQPFQYAG